MEDTIDKDIPINKNNVRRKLRVIIVSRDNCKDYLKKADNAMSDLNDMASSRLLLCGIGVGKLYIYPPLFTFGMHNAVYEHNIP